MICWIFRTVSDLNQLGGVVGIVSANGSHNSIAAFAIDQETGKLDFIERESTEGEIPRNFGIDPSGKFLIVGNQCSNCVVVLKINQDTASLGSTSHEIKVPASVCIRFLKLSFTFR